MGDALAKFKRFGQKVVEGEVMGNKTQASLKSFRPAGDFKLNSFLGSSGSEDTGGVTTYGQLRPYKQSLGILKNLAGSGLFASNSSSFRNSPFKFGSLNSKFAKSSLFTKPGSSDKDESKAGSTSGSALKGFSKSLTLRPKFGSRKMALPNKFPAFKSSLASLNAEPEQPGGQSNTKVKKTLTAGGSHNKELAARAKEKAVRSIREYKERVLDSTNAKFQEGVVKASQELEVTSAAPTLSLEPLALASASAESTYSHEEEGGCAKNTSPAVGYPKPHRLGGVSLSNPALKRRNLPKNFKAILKNIEDLAGEVDLIKDMSASEASELKNRLRHVEYRVDTLGSKLEKVLINSSKLAAEKVSTAIDEAIFKANSQVKKLQVSYEKSNQSMEEHVGKLKVDILTCQALAEKIYGSLKKQVSSLLKSNEDLLKETSLIRDEALKRQDFETLKRELYGDSGMDKAINLEEKLLGDMSFIKSSIENLVALRVKGLDPARAAKVDVSPGLGRAEEHNSKAHHSSHKRLTSSNDDAYSLEDVVNHRSGLKNEVLKSKASHNGSDKHNAKAVHSKSASEGGNRAAGIAQPKGSATQTPSGSTGSSSYRGIPPLSAILGGDIPEGSLKAASATSKPGPDASPKEPEGSSSKAQSQATAQQAGASSPLQARLSESSDPLLALAVQSLQAALDVDQLSSAMQEKPYSSKTAASVGNFPKSAEGKTAAEGQSVHFAPNATGQVAGGAMGGSRDPSKPQAGSEASLHGSSSTPQGGAPSFVNKNNQVLDAELVHNKKSKPQASTHTVVDNTKFFNKLS